jgi:hypothetical protein
MSFHRKPMCRITLSCHPPAHANCFLASHNGARPQNVTQPSLVRATIRGLALIEGWKPRNICRIAPSTTTSTVHRKLSWLDSGVTAPLRDKSWPAGSPVRSVSQRPISRPGRQGTTGACFWRPGSRLEAREAQQVPFCDT